MSEQEAEKKIVNVDDDSFVVLRLHYRADPEKDEKWADKARREYPQEDWDREFELKPVGHEGDYAVFGDYRRQIHEDENLVWKKGADRPIIRGWDFGRVHPCVEFLQVDGMLQNSIGEVYGDNIFLPQFIESVLMYSKTEFPLASFRDACDNSGLRESDIDGKSDVKVLRSYGINPSFRWQEVEDGIRLVCKSLIQLVGGRPQYMLNPRKCPHLAAAMRGGYRRNKNGKLIKDGIHDHSPDALRYAFDLTTKIKTGHWDSVKQKAIQYRYKPKNPFTGY